MLNALRTNFRQVSDVLSEGIDANGGYLVPEEYDSRLIDTLTEENIMRKETVRLQPISADFGVGDFGSTIWLAFGSSVMKDSVQSITLLYDGDVGNLTDVLNNSPCGSFQTSFIYTPYEEEET